MTPSRYAELRTHSIGSALGARPPRFSRRMFDQHPGDATYACAITKYRTPRYDWALYVVAVLAVAVIWLTR
jgi:hypothetical protein